MALLAYDRGLIAGLCPLVVGEEFVEPRSGKTVLDNLFHNHEFKALRDALPRTVPAATWGFVARTMAAVGLSLPPSWLAMSVADVMCGSARMQPGAVTSGLFLKDVYFLDGDKEKLRLLLMREFADKVRRRIGVAAAELRAAAGEAALEAAVQHLDLVAAPAEAEKDDAVEPLEPCTPPLAAGSSTPPQRAAGAARVVQAVLGSLRRVFSFDFLHTTAPLAVRDASAPLRAALVPESAASKNVPGAPPLHWTPGKRAADAGIRRGDDAGPPAAYPPQLAHGNAASTVLLDAAAPADPELL
jgi:hypothetical protein